MQKCPLCDYQNDDVSRFCINCGESLRFQFSVKYAVVRASPGGITQEKLHEQLLKSLQELGYSILYPGPPIRAAKGSKRVIDDDTLIRLAKSLLDSGQRTIVSLDIKHKLIVSANAEQITFDFRVGERFIELPFLERRDKMALEMIADEVMQKFGVPATQVKVNPALKARINRLILLYDQISEAYSFGRTTIFLFMFPVIVEFAGSVVGWTTHWVIEGYGELRLPVALKYNPSIWDLQLLISTAFFCFIVALGLFVDWKIARVLIQYGQNLDAKLRDPSLGYALRDSLRQLDIRLIRWTPWRMVLALAGGATLVFSLVLSVSHYRVLSLVGYFIGTILVAFSCNLASYGGRKQRRIGRVLPFLWFYAALAWMLYWYNSYMISWTINGIEIRDIWFLAGYASGLVLLMFYFAYWEIKEHARDIYNVLIGEAPRERLTLGVRSCLALGFYAVALAVLRLPLPLPTTSDSTAVTTLLYGAVNDILGKAEAVFLGLFSLLPSIIIATAFLRYLWKRRFHVRLSRVRAIKALALEAWGFVMDKGKEMAIFVVGLLLLWIATHEAHITVTGQSESLYITSAVIEFVVILLVAIKYYDLSRRTAVIAIDDNVVPQ